MTVKCQILTMRQPENPREYFLNLYLALSLSYLINVLVSMLYSSKDPDFLRQRYIKFISGVPAGEMAH